LLSANSEVNSETVVAQPVAASSFVQLQRLAEGLWSYRTNPE